MSRSYKWFTQIKQVLGAQCMEVSSCLEDEFGMAVDAYNAEDGTVTLVAEAEYELSGGRTVAEEARDIREAVWRNAGTYVPVSVGAVCLEDPEWIVEGNQEECAAYLAEVAAQAKEEADV